MHVRFKERVTADSLLGKAVSCAISVVEADRVQGGAATKRVRREISISVAALNGPHFGKPVGLYVWKNDTATSEK